MSMPWGGGYYRLSTLHRTRAILRRRAIAGQPGEPASGSESRRAYVSASLFTP